MDGASLATIPLFAELPAEKRDQVAGVCSDLDVNPGTALIVEGDFGYAMFVVIDGTAEVLKDGEVIRRLGPGDVFGEIAVLSGGRRTATVVAKTPMRLATVMNRDVWRLERDVPDVGASLRTTIADCLSR